MPPPPFPSPLLRRRLILAGLVLVGVWVFFLDSHSVLKRLQASHERRTLHVEVQELREQNLELEARLRQGVTDDIVEEVAREQYGMRRAGETVYPTEKGGR